MSDRYPHPDPNYLRALAERDPVGLYLYVRSSRNAYLREEASALLLSAGRHVNRWFEASQRLPARQGRGKR